MNDIMKIIKSLEESGLKKGASEKTKNEAKEQKGRFLSMLLGTLDARLSGSAGKGTFRAVQGTITTGESTIKAGQDF